VFKRFQLIRRAVGTRLGSSGIAYLTAFQLYDINIILQVEFGTPKDLIVKENGKLRNLIHESADRDILIEMADKGVGKTRAGI
jgi:hypothetical protein